MQTKSLILYFLLMMFSFNAHALDVVQGPDTSTVSCTPVTTYTDDTPVREGDIAYRLYMNDTAIQEGAECSFVVAHGLPVGNSILYATAVSAFYNTESSPSNTIEYNIFEPISPNVPTQLNWE